MQMAPPIRRAALTLHIVASVGWLGTVAAFFVLAVLGWMDAGGTNMRACYPAMDTITRLAIVPFCLASLTTGIVQALGTSWGLARHYWVAIKLVLTLGSTAILLLHTQPIREAAVIASDASHGSDMGGLQAQLVLDSGAAIVVLLVTTALSVYKPKGETRYGRRGERAGSGERSARSSRRP